MTVIAELKRACKSFSVGAETVLAVDNVDFTVARGDMTCVFGASGSGKTTMLNILAGIETADSGTVAVVGKSLTGLSEADRARIRLHNIGVVFQANNLLPEFAARENVELPLLARGVSRVRAAETARSSLASVGLHDLADRLPARMSGGQRQRVGIARALAGGQELLLADEPTGALDSDNSRQLFALMRSLCDDHGTAIVLATHDPLAGEFATTTHQMVDGRLGIGTAARR